MRLFFAFTFIFLAPLPLAAEPANDVQDLRGLMADRLAVMAYVAAYKWNQGLEIEDKAREKRVLAQTLASADVNGTDADGAEAVALTQALKAQMEAAKRVQLRLFEVWEAEGKDRTGAVPDLQISLRPRIGRLSNNLIATFLAARDDLGDCAAYEVLMPVPPHLADFPKAWALAVEGVLGLDAPCPAHHE